MDQTHDGGNSDAIGMWVDFSDFKVEKTIKTIIGGANCTAGSTVDWDTGLITKLDEDSPLQCLGITAGMRFLTLDAEPYSKRLMNRKVALQMDFVAVFSTGAKLDYDVNQQEEGFAIKRFANGKVGDLSCEKNTGRIHEMQPDGQAANEGITRGMLIRTINGVPYSESVLKANLENEHKLDIAFLKCPDYGTKRNDRGEPVDSSRNAALVISRSSRRNSYLPDENAWSNAGFDWMDAWQPNDENVVEYLCRFGFEAESREIWQQRPSAGQVKLGVNVEHVIQRKGYWWYVVECTITDGSKITSWLAPRQLVHFQKGLLERVQPSLGLRYEPLFENVHFPADGTGRTMSLWLGNLVGYINAGVVSPELSALVLNFLMAPITSDTKESPPPDLCRVGNNE